MSDTIQLSGFKQPIPKEIFFGVNQAYDDGTPLTLIPEWYEISARKVRAILHADWPEGWRAEYDKRMKGAK